MRASPRLLADCEAELKARPDNTGKALMGEYARAVNRLDDAVENCEFSNVVMNNVSEGARRLQSWYDRKVKERTEKPRKRSDA